ncbi:[NiFe]-hydrogenase assembly chaperone HybE [Hydrogenophaga sp. 5NK40-0174]|uniref:[NiFe]-hydrogenase assembly chaperone HybE n=1 Tax=Hydrogenophaga sp. 5NK40-0174 TaxID=3127649 RepID=UPI00310C410C
MTTATPFHQDASLQARVDHLVAHYEMVHRERMTGLPVVNPVLRVEAVGFIWVVPEGEGEGEGEDEDEDEDEGEAYPSRQPIEPMAEGVLVTPWFMSLVRLPANVQAHKGRVGKRFRRLWGTDAYDFLGSHDEGIGYHETCSLFSPMNDFDQHAVAIETAMQVVQLARPAAKPAERAQASAEPVPSRRSFFLARRPGGGAA